MLCHLVRVVDGVVLTVRGQMTKRHVAQLTVDRLHQVGARVLGVVLNSVSYRSNYYYDYGSAYSYHYDQRARGNS
jgi:Mrp family chromosome partitioning ATPase